MADQPVRYMLDVDAPTHEHTLMVTTRPLPGRFLGHLNPIGMVHDVAPEFEQQARDLDGQPITVVTRAVYEALVEAAVNRLGYTKEKCQELDCWDPDELGQDFGLPLVRMREEPQ